jgi:hypothetical protein
MRTEFVATGATDDAVSASMLRNVLVPRLSGTTRNATCAERFDPGTSGIHEDYIKKMSREIVLCTTGRCVRLGRATSLETLIQTQAP